MENPKLSVVIPIWGVEKYIEKCARSLFKSTQRDIEFIFIDDCTPDKSMEILSQVIEENRHIITKMNWVVRTERMPTNSGLPAVRRHGTQLATGDYIIHCDSDDSVDKEMYSKLYEKATLGNYDIVQCDLLLYNENGILWQTNYDKEKSSDQFRIDLINRKISNSLCNKLVKRDLYQRSSLYFPKYPMDEDNVLTCQLAYYAKKLAYVHEPLYLVYSNPTSITRQKNIDKYLRDLYGQIENNRWIVDFLECNHDNQLSDALFYYKHMVKIMIARYGKYYDSPKNVYSEINKKLLLGSGIDLKGRLRNILILFFPHLYSKYCMYRFRNTIVY